MNSPKQSTVDERMNDALEDFRGLVCEGHAVQNALAEAAQAHGFSEEALGRRAQKRYGQLEELPEKFSRDVSFAQREWASKSAVREYGKLDELVPAKEWLAQRLGREATEAELEEALDLAMRHWASKFPANIWD